MTFSNEWLLPWGSTHWSDNHFNRKRVQISWTSGAMNHPLSTLQSFCVITLYISTLNYITLYYKILIINYDIYIIQSLRYTIIRWKVDFFIMRLTHFSIQYIFLNNIYWKYVKKNFHTSKVIYNSERN